MKNRRAQDEAMAALEPQMTPRARAISEAYRRPRAWLRCPERHVLGEVVQVDGRRLLHRPRVRVRRSLLDSDHQADDLSEVTFAARTYDLDNPADSEPALALRCKCKSWITSTDQVRERLDGLTNEQYAIRMD